MFNKLSITDFEADGGKGALSEGRIQQVGYEGERAWEHSPRPSSAEADFIDEIARDPNLTNKQKAQEINKFVKSLKSAKKSKVISVEHFNKVKGYAKYVKIAKLGIKAFAVTGIILDLLWPKTAHAPTLPYDPMAPPTYNSNTEDTSEYIFKLPEPDVQ